MIHLRVLTGIIFSAIICFFIPLGALFLLQKRGKKIAKAFFIGAATFFVSQIVLRIPLITYILPYQHWYIRLLLHPIWYSLFLGFTAGLFEETGRFLFIKFFLKKHRAIDGIAFGLGHGGIEAILFVGISMILYLITAISIKIGFLPALSNVFGSPIVASLSNQVVSLSPISIWFTGIERFFTMILHIGLTMLVLNGFFKNQTYRHLIAAILIHAVIDASVGILPALFGIGTATLEIVIALYALSLFVYTIFAYQKMNSNSELRKAELS